MPTRRGFLAGCGALAASLSLKGLFVREPKLKPGMHTFEHYTDSFTLSIMHCVNRDRWRGCKPATVLVSGMSAVREEHGDGYCWKVTTYIDHNPDGTFGRMVVWDDRPDPRQQWQTIHPRQHINFAQQDFGKQIA